MLNLGKRVSFPLAADATLVLLRHRPGIYWAVVLRVEGSARCSDLRVNAHLGGYVAGKGSAVIDVSTLV